jgi:hypothetical protein
VVIRLAVAGAAIGAIVSTAPVSGGWRTTHVVRQRANLAAELSYQTRVNAGFRGYRRMRLNVRLDGRVVIDAAVPSKDLNDSGYGSVGLSLRDVWGSPAPEALVALNTGGNTCCAEVDVGVVHGMHGTMLFRNFGMSWGGQRHAGRFYFVSADYRFYCAFSDCASSAQPVQVFAVDAPGERLVDVTRSRLDLVQQDAVQEWSGYQRELHDRSNSYGPLGVLAPWCADQDLLGNDTACQRELSRVRAPASDVASLRRSLRAWGYAPK